MEKIENFKKELNDLLTKYPDLPEMTITIRPRVSFDEKKPQTTFISPGKNTVPLPYFPTPSNPPYYAGVTTATGIADTVSGVPKITNARIEEMKQMTETA